MSNLMFPIERERAVSAVAWFSALMAALSGGHGAKAEEALRELELLRLRVRFLAEKRGQS